MLILPAIDIRNGRCVRLRQGDYNDETVFGDDPVAMAQHWAAQGATSLHLVDLDGAKEGRPVNAEWVRRIVEDIEIPCQLGGGIRTTDDVCRAFSWGVERVVVGTRAIREPQWLEEISTRYPGRIVLGIDARDGKIAVEGWLETSAISAEEFVVACAHLPLGGIVYTDIRRDGMMQGPNFDAMRGMVARVATPIIASGGVTTEEDVFRLRDLGVAGCIVGRALYEGRIDLKTLLEKIRSD